MLLNFPGSRMEICTTRRGHRQGVHQGFLRSNHSSGCCWARLDGQTDGWSPSSPPQSAWQVLVYANTRSLPNSKVCFYIRLFAVPIFVLKKKWKMCLTFWARILDGFQPDFNGRIIPEPIAQLPWCREAGAQCTTSWTQVQPDHGTTSTWWNACYLDDNRREASRCHSGVQPKGRSAPKEQSRWRSIQINPKPDLWYQRGILVSVSVDSVFMGRGHVSIGSEAGFNFTFLQFS